MAAEAGADLAIVSSPLQYMNAVEWRAAEGGGPCDLVLIGDRHDSDDRIAKLMRRHAPWRTVLRTGRRPRPPRAVPRFVKDLLDAAHRTGLERLARRLGQAGYRRVAFGDYRNVSHRLLVDRLTQGEAILLDDGSVTPQAAAFRADPGGAPEPGQFDLAWFRTPLARRLFGDEALPEPRSVVFFSIYGRLIGDRLAPGDRLLPNAYAVWGRAGEGAVRDTSAWLIGADHGEAGICAADDYRALVLKAGERLRAEGYDPIVYRPHRGQSARTAAELADAAGMVVAPSTAPVELDYLDGAERPAAVVVFASSAADTLAALDPTLALARIALPPIYLRKRADHIRAVVAAHDAFNPELRVIDLDADGPLAGRPSR